MFAKITKIALCALLFTLALVPTSQEKEMPAESDVEFRIFFGEDADIKSYPFFAGLNNCGAVIIAPMWVLTVAHCVKDIYHDSVWVGSESGRKSQRHAISKILYHQYYDDELFLNDIALIKLKKSLKFSSKVQPALLPYPQELQAVKDEEYKMIGRGTDENGSMALLLQQSMMNVYSAKECYYNYHSETYYYLSLVGLIEEINQNFICSIRDDNLPGLCNGDSGSPIVQGNVLIGLGSYSYNLCENPDFFSVNVEHYLPWIKFVTEMNA